MVTQLQRRLARLAGRAIQRAPAAISKGVRELEKLNEAITEGLPRSPGDIVPAGQRFREAIQATPADTTRTVPLQDPTPVPTTVLQQDVQPQQPMQTTTTEMIDMTPADVVREIVNNPDIQLTADMLPAINDNNVFMDSNGVLFTDQFRFDKLEPKKKKKVSKYNKELAKQIKILRKKHPRTKVTALMAKAHRATRKALGMPAKRRRSR